ncbi:MAG TPA: hypothetical protein VM282_14215 [Acidimicrobiales bacterium]|nr:hypothetical protein [Acidimicrobiales bacterium]
MGRQRVEADSGHMWVAMTPNAGEQTMAARPAHHRCPAYVHLGQPEEERAEDATRARLPVVLAIAHVDMLLEAPRSTGLWIRDGDGCLVETDL